MELKERLKRIGLSNNEAVVYVCLVDYGSSKAGKIAKECELQRSSAYSAINSLVNKGLISYVKIGKIKYFNATSPKRLLEFIREQEEIVSEAIPELEKRHKATKSEGQVSLFKGKKGVKSVFKDMIRDGKDNLVFGDDGNLRKNMPIFCQQYVKEQNLNGIKTKVLTRIRSTSHSKGSSYRFVGKGVESNMAVNIYGDKIAFVVWTDIPEAVVIENKTAANSMRAYFNFMWKSAKK